MARLAELKAKRANRQNAAAASSGSAAPASKTSYGSAAATNDILKETSALVGGDSQLEATAAIEVHNIPPKEKHNYEVGCQTDGAPVLTGKAKDMEAELQEQLAQMRIKEDKLAKLQDQLKADKLRYDAIREEERLKEPVEMSHEESKKILESDSFRAFFSKASRMMERALSSGGYDVTVDYSGGANEIAKEQDLVLVNTFKDKITGGRPITSLSWSPKHPELFLASYASQENPMSFDPDGTVRVWNTRMPGRPEFSFYCSSAVLSAFFHPTHPHLIIGACESGQVVIWDTREKEYPVNRTSLSNGHTHPVHGIVSLPVVGGKMHNILSISTDGHLCVWNDKDLHSPSTELRLEQGKDEITTTCIDYPERDANTVILGSDEGRLYKAHVYDKAGIFENIPAHDAPISNIAFNPALKNSNLADLFLTSSYDWTVKLWSLKSSKPLYTFESARDYVYDAQWSPVHPSLFCMGDGSGNVDMWNIAKDSEAPVYSTKLPDHSNNSAETAAVSRIAWNHSGSHIAIGTSSGAICLYAVRSELATASADDSSEMYDKVNGKLLSLSI